MGFTNAGLTNGGQTAHYNVTYDETFSPADGVNRANALLDACEQDFALMQGWFAGVNFEFSFPISVQIANASGGASWTDPPNIALPFGYSPTVVIKPGTGSSVNFVRYLLVSEVTEMFMASQSRGWYQNTSLFSGADEGSKGEGLSRFLGVQFQIANNLGAIPPAGFGLVSGWLNGARGNFVDTAPDDNNPDQTNGCTTCFIYFLHNQLGFSINQIIAAGASTLAGAYTNLTGKTDAWSAFSGLVNLHYPPGTTYNPLGDNLFPVPNLSTLSDDGIESGTSKTDRMLTLDTQALAEVTVSLSSDNPALLSVLPQVTFPVGTWSAAVTLQAAAVTGPAQTVRIHATYAGKTLNANVQIVPRPSVIAGQVTDSAFGPINDATILIQSDTIILPLSGNTLQLSTDANGRYQTPAIPPHVYQVSAMQSGYVPGQASVTVNLGVPVTTQNFTLAKAKPFTIVGKVTDGFIIGKVIHPIAGATITLDQNSPIPGRIQIKTDTNGQYSLSMNPGSYNGTYTLSAEDAGYATSSVAITIPNGATITENFALEPLGSLTGAIVAAGNVPVAGATVSIGSVSTKSDTAGHYTLTGLTPGLNNVKVSAAGFDSSEIAVTILSGIATTQNFTLMKASGIITGTVTDGELGDPLSGSTVVIIGLATTKTDDNGNYTFSNVPAGQFQVTVGHLRYQSGHSVVQINDHQTIELDFELSQTGVKRPLFSAKAS